MAADIRSDKITKEQLQGKLQGFQDGLTSQVEDKKKTLIAVAAASGVVVLLLFFLLGRRSGNKKRTVVEIRRL
jgi:hypothetical protein